MLTGKPKNELQAARNANAADVMKRLERENAELIRIHSVRADLQKGLEVLQDVWGKIEEIQITVGNACLEVAPHEATYCSYEKAKEALDKASDTVGSAIGMQMGSLDSNSRGIGEQLHQLRELQAEAEALGLPKLEVERIGVDTESTKDAGVSVDRVS